MTKWEKYKRAVWQRVASPEKIEEVRNDSEPAVRFEEKGRSSYSQSGSLIDMDKALELYKQQQKEVNKKKGK